MLNAKSLEKLHLWFKHPKEGQGLDTGFEAQADTSLLKSHRINNTSEALEKVVMEFDIVSNCWHYRLEGFENSSMYLDVISITKWHINDMLLIIL